MIQLLWFSEKIIEMFWWQKIHNRSEQNEYFTKVSVKVNLNIYFIYFSLEDIIFHGFSTNAL